jgi:phosphinothricin acetyltransferase
MNAPFAGATADPGMPGLRVSNATAADLASVTEIWNEGLVPGVPGEGTHDWQMSHELALRWLTGHQSHLRPLWIARLNGRPVGLLSFLGFTDRPGCYATAELSIHIRRGDRSRGIGRALVMRAVASAAMLGYDRYVALIRRDNKASLGLFRRCGFRLWGRMHGVMQAAGKRHDLLVFGIEL